ncbi:MAG: archease [Nanoarchaeota archaeon]
MQKFKFLPHTADIKFQAFGKDLEECFKNGAFAVTNIICKQKIKPIKNKKIKVYGRDLENLLYNFLEEILFLIDVYDLLISDIKLKIIGTGAELKKRKYELEAEIYGDNIKKYNTELVVKAITYNNMFIKSEKIKGKTVFTCQVVVDV